MRWFLVLVLVVGVAAANKNAVSVAEFSDRVNSPRPGQQSDKAMARQLARVLLTERISSDTLLALLARSPGPKTKSVLEIQAARSALSQLPEAERFTRPAPSQEEQSGIMARLTNYLSNYLYRLPNFFCTETVLRFDDDTDARQVSDYSIGRLRFRDIIVRRATYFDRKESLQVELVNGKPASLHPARGLQSNGEFGDILVMLFSQRSQLKADFSHWESLHTKPVAVFTYAIAKANSGYKIQTDRRRTDGPLEPIQAIVAFHGTFSVDPATGAILRVTIQIADLPDDFLMRNLSLVLDYEPIAIGGVTFICPWRSVVQSDTLAPFFTNHGYYLVHTLNQTSYSKYRRYEAQSRLSFDAPQ